MGIGNIANTGMRAAMSDMEVVSNNIANANTAGFKRSYATFGDIYPSSSGASQTPGLGVQVTSIKQDFNRGGTAATGKGSDLMIQGAGFFITKNSNSGLQSYTRAGGFILDNQGYISNGQQRLQGYAATNGAILAGSSLSDIQIDFTPRPATATSTITTNVNLDANSPIIAATFDEDDTATFSYTTKADVYDSLGNQHNLSLYYAKSAANTWDVYALVDGTSVGTGEATFTANGTLSGVTGLSSLSFAPGTGATTPQSLAVTLTNSTQFAGDNSTRSVSGNGYSVGEYNGYNIDNSGNVTVGYSNGESVLLSKVAVALFQSPEGLTSIGNMSWVETAASGAPDINIGNSDSNLAAGQIELSNVDLTQEMISLIGAQHNFQANAQVEQTYNEVMQTIIQI